MALCKTFQVLFNQRILGNSTLLTLGDDNARFCTLKRRRRRTHRKGVARDTGPPPLIAVHRCCCCYGFPRQKCCFAPEVVQNRPVHSVSCPSLQLRSGPV